jgi:hypothetical protein
MQFPPPPAGKSLNESQKEKTADEHDEGNPKMNVGEHDRHPISGSFTLFASFHLFLLASQKAR